MKEPVSVFSKIIILSGLILFSNGVFVSKALLMQVTPSDIEKGMKSPVIWDRYKEIINQAEGHQVNNVFLH